MICVPIFMGMSSSNFNVQLEIDVLLAKES